MRNRAPGQPGDVNVSVGEGGVPVSVPAGGQRPPAPPQQLGGAPGLPPELRNVAQAPLPKPGALRDRKVERARRFRVINGGSIVMNGCRVNVRAGKIVDATMYDLDSLRTHGFKLEPIDPETPAAPMPLVGEEKPAEEPKTA